MRRPMTLAAAVAVAVAGCGGGSGGGGKPVALGPGKPLVVKAREFRFDPANVVVKGGGALRIELTNAGSQAHDLHVERDGSDIGGTPIFGPGQTKTATVKLSHGKYDFICTVGDHAAEGMKGTLTVK